MRRLTGYRTLTIAIGACLIATATQAATPEYELAIESHRFVPVEIVVPAGQKVRLRVENRDPTPEEFESYDLNRERIVPAKGSITIFVGPLKPGRYKFFGDFNPDTAQGTLVAE